MQVTLDPFVFIEEQSHGYVRYINTDGLRWEVIGVCDGRLDCMVGAVVNGVLINSIEQARLLPKPTLDCPVAVGFKGCCPLEIQVCKEL